MISLITETQNLTNQNHKSVIGVVNDAEGFRELEETVLNSNYHDDKIIDRLKDLLAESTTSEGINGVIIDDFGSLYALMEAASSSGEMKSDLIYSQNLNTDIDYKHNLIREKQRLLLEKHEESKENLLKEGREVFDTIENTYNTLNNKLILEVDFNTNIIKDEVSTNTVIVTSKASDEDGSDIKFTIDDTVNYDIDKNSGTVRLTTEGINKVNNGENLPTFKITANSTSGKTSSNDVEISPIIINSEEGTVIINTVSNDDVINALESKDTTI
ncbi:MAG: hypothetical protein MJK08_13350, partial [Campylobacterales bacterium]|nr:hypothetical protein [Campylobacterales bacterium]